MKIQMQVKFECDHVGWYFLLKVIFWHLKSFNIYAKIEINAKYF